MNRTSHTEGYLPVPAGRLWYEVDGAANAPALTLIHAGVAHLRMWDDDAPAFVAAGYRVIRYDTRGFGRTETEDDPPFSNRADLAALLDHLGVERTHLLGISRGGTIALDFTLERPERVLSLTIVASTPSGFQEPEDPAAVEAWHRSMQLEEARDWPALVDLEVDMWLEGPGQPRGRTGERLRRAMTTWGLENYTDDRKNGTPQPLDPPAAGRLGEVKVPTQVIWGNLDEAGVLAGSPAIAKGIAGAEQHVLPGVAHMVNLERPDAFRQLVLDFLRRSELVEG